MSKKTFDIWAEGWAANGDGVNPARLVAKDVEAENFLSACIAADRRHWVDEKAKGEECTDFHMSAYGLGVRNGKPFIWGCQLFDNEAEAREFMG